MWPWSPVRTQPSFSTSSRHFRVVVVAEEHPGVADHDLALLAELDLHTRVDRAHRARRLDPAGRAGDGPRLGGPIDVLQRHPEGVEEAECLGRQRGAEV